MYIDYHKYNYGSVSSSDLKEYEERDKAAYKKVVQEWLERNLDEITERKWEVEEIGFLKEVSDFIKLIKEGETLFELGFYTSCIALIGISSEDFSKYLSLKLGRNSHLEKTQYQRLKNQKAESILTSEQFELLDEIRKKRNDCLHYNDNFKSKDNNELKQDALVCLNNLKKTIKNILGTSNELNEKELVEIISDITNQIALDNAIGTEMRLKTRNAMSYLFNLDITFSPGKKHEIKNDYFIVKEIDFDLNETTLAPVSSPGLYVIVEMPEKDKEYFMDNGIKENDTVWATLYSEISDIGITEEWFFVNVRKEDNFTEIFHELVKKHFE